MIKFVDPNLSIFIASSIELLEKSFPDNDDAIAYFGNHLNSLTKKAILLSPGP